MSLPPATTPRGSQAGSSPAPAGRRALLSIPYAASKEPRQAEGTFFSPFPFLFRRICSLGKCWSPHGPTEQRGSRGAWFSERGGLQQDSLSLHPRKPSQVLRPFKQTAAVNTYPCLWPPWKTQVHSPNNQETQMREIRCRHAEFSSTRGNAGTPGCPV